MKTQLGVPLMKQTINKKKKKKKKKKTLERAIIKWIAGFWIIQSANSRRKWLIAVTKVDEASDTSVPFTLVDPTVSMWQKKGINSE